MNHRQEYEEHKKKRGQRALWGYVIGVSCLVLFELLQRSSAVADFMERAEQSREDSAFFFQVFAAIISYVLPTVGASAIIFTTYMLLFKKDDD